MASSSFFIFYIPGLAVFVFFDVYFAKSLPVFKMFKNQSVMMFGEIAVFLQY
ncbi:hypothetical protein PRUB_a3382 [Pseudoalteromonas rubra]|uniref:Uncharacterized protein n=1 Tax=Pseudoalteromonas rubra TaxID=43658 RepID=A0A8T0C4Q7_9GAMM|nr:hypothetical protein PRUB_a3382 [Pseudoalteromonas rubra]